MKIDCPAIWNGNITYVPIGGDISTYITAATAGDTLILAAGTYTITSGITVNKKLHIMGQGVGITSIACSTDALTFLIDSTAAGSRISNMTINRSGTLNTDGIMIRASASCDIENMNFTSSAAGAATFDTVMHENCVGTINIQNCTSSMTGVVGTHYFARMSTANAATVNIRNCYLSGSGGTVAGFGNIVIHQNGANSTTNIYDTTIKDTSNITGGVVTTNNGACNIYHSTLNGSGTGAFDVKNNAGTLTLYDTTLVNNTTSGTISYGTTSNLSVFKGGNIKYIPLTDGTLTQTQILTNAITNASAGDTLILAAGTYTITAGLTVNKLLHIQGQGEGITTITCATDVNYMFTMSSAGSRISNMTISASGARTGAGDTSIFNISASCDFANLQVTSTTTGAKATECFNNTANANTVNVENCTWSSTGAINQHMLWYGQAGASVYYFRNCKADCSNGQQNVYGAMVIFGAAGTANLYNCVFNDTTNKVGGVLATDGGTINSYNCIINGSGATNRDVFNSSGTLTLYDTTLVNNTTSGTITYGGTVYTKDIKVGSTPILVTDVTNNRVGIGCTPTTAGLSIDSNSNTACLRLFGADEVNEIADLYVDASGNLNIDTTAGNDTGSIYFKSENTAYGYLFYESDGTGTTAYANLGVFDTSVDYLNLCVKADNSVTNGLVIDENQNIGVGCQPSAPSTAVTTNLVCQPYINNAKLSLIEEINNLVGTSNIKGFWIFDQTGATTSITDRSPNSHTLTTGGNASTLSPAVSGLCPNLTMAGTAATAWSVANNADFSFGDGAGNDSAFTIICLMNPVDNTTNVMVGKIQSSASKSEWDLGTSNADKLWFYVSNPDETKYLIRYYNTAITSDEGSWHVYAGTASGGSPQAIGGLKVYRDGVQVDDTTTTAGVYAGMTAGTAVVANSSNNAAAWSKAKYGVVLIINKALTAAEVKRLSLRLLSYSGSFQ